MQSDAIISSTAAAAGRDGGGQRDANRINASSSRLRALGQKRLHQCGNSALNSKKLLNIELYIVIEKNSLFVEKSSFMIVKD